MSGEATTGLRVREEEVEHITVSDGVHEVQWEKQVNKATCLTLYLSRGYRLPWNYTINIQKGRDI